MISVLENNNTNKNKMKIGTTVSVVKKEDQGTEKRVKGKIKRFLTKKKHHPRGLKVELKDGTIGRVQKILD